MASPCGSPTSNGVGSRRIRGSAQSTFGRPFWVLQVRRVGGRDRFARSSSRLVHDILRFAPDDHPDLRAREGAVVIGEADSIASCDSICLDPYGYVSDCLECLSFSLGPHCFFLLSAVPLGFHMTGSIITPRPLGSAPPFLPLLRSRAAPAPHRRCELASRLRHWRPAPYPFRRREPSQRAPRSIRCRSSSADLSSSASIRS